MTGSVPKEKNIAIKWRRHAGVPTSRDGISSIFVNVLIVEAGSPRRLVVEFCVTKVGVGDEMTKVPRSTPKYYPILTKLAEHVARRLTSIISGIQSEIPHRRENRRF